MIPFWYKINHKKGKGITVKKTGILMLILFCIFSFTACGRTSVEDTEKGELVSSTAVGESGSCAF